METKRRGRPQKSSGEAKTIRIDLRVTEAEKEAFKREAEKAGLGLSEWIRKVLSQGPER